MYLIFLGYRRGEVIMRGFFCALAICGLVSILLSACTPPTKVSTSLTGTAAHTGTLTVLRVDDGWRGNIAARTPYRLGDGIGKRTPRFVPIRGKNDVAVFDTPDRRVTNDDFVTVTLNSAFIKYFRESSIAGSASGEIAMVVSFSAGSTVKEDFLIMSSRGQTLGSFLDVQDWPAIGPVKIDGDSLTMRIVIIELDQVENESMKQFIKAAAGFVGTVVPQAGAALKVAQGVADFVIGQNGDDVVFDQRFGFQRMDEGRVLTRMPLLFGKYVLVMQEDALSGTGAARNAPSAAMQVPAPDDMRYDLHFDRLYKVYPYRPDVKPADCPDVTSTAVSLGMGMDMGKGTIEWPQFFPAPGDLVNELASLYWDNPAYKDCVLKEHVNSADAQNFRRTAVGFEQPYLGDLELFGDLDRTLKVAYLESTRTVSSQYEKFPDTGSVTFNYPIVQYPQAAVFLGQYPLQLDSETKCNTQLCWVCNGTDLQPPRFNREM